MPVERDGISIHAPAKGATGVMPRSGSWDYDFNPRSREGSDWPSSSCFLNLSNFNPRSREGSDLSSVKGSLTKLISIHAPAKGATTIVKSDIQGLQFQSTLPRRERPGSSFPSVPNLPYFNPRSREGSDKWHPS